MVEDDKRFGFDKEQVGDAQFVGIGVGQVFVLADEVIGGVADAARPEVGQVGGSFGLADGQVPKHAQGVGAAEALRAFGGADAHHAAARLDAPPLAGANKRVAGDALALFDTFQKKTWVSGNLEVRRKRRLQVG